MNKLIIQYNNLSKQVKASIWFIISNVMVKGMSFITLPIFSRLLTTEEYGVVSTYQSWVSVISVVATLTIWGGVFNVGMVKFWDQRYKLISSFQGLATTLTLIIACLNICLLRYIGSWFGISNFLIVCVYIEILVQTPFYIWSTEQRYCYEYKSLIVVTVLISVLSPLIGYVAVTNSVHKAEARIVSNLIVQLIVGIAFFIHNQRRGRKFYDSAFWKFGFEFNVVLIPHYLSTQILNQSDRLMINSICGSGDAGIYSVAYNFAMLLSLVTNGINSSLTPHIYQCLKDNNAGKLKKQTTAVVLIVAVMTMGLIAIVPDIFTLLLPESYYPALKVIPPVAAGAFFLFLYPLFGSVEFYFEENRYVTFASMFGAVLNVILNYIFIKIFGFMAAAYTTLSCYLGFSVCHYVFMKKVMKKNGLSIDIYDIKWISIISVAVVAGTMIMLCLYDNFIARWSIIVLIFAVAIIKRRQLINFVKTLKM